MASSNNRPVYVPKRKRRQQPQRFHGAFTGGFSAGYFNTVGSEQGWKPTEHHATSDEPSSQQQQQRPEDFMDEQDHNEWGGPVAVKAEYRGETGTKKQKKETFSALTDELFASSSSEPVAVNIGERLLKKLGWRPGAQTDDIITAYVRTNKQKHDDDDDEDAIYLSERRLKKIVRQQQRITIPENRKGTAGLGYESLKDAPEFKAAREKRQEAARQRAQQAVSKLHNNNKSVYRVSDALPAAAMMEEDENEEDEQLHQSTAAAAAAAYETMEDFVGRKSVSGFALREDDDDAYDDDGGDERKKDDTKRRKINSDDYDNVAYEHVDSDDQDEEAVQKAAAVHDAFGGVLSSWAASSTSTKQEKGASATNGLPGFVLGSSGAAQQQQARYRGPDVPPDFIVKPHIFGPNEHPAIFAALSRAVQLEVADERRQAEFQEALERATVKPTLPPSQQQPKSTTTAFAGVGAAMRNRFTTASSTTTMDDNSAIATNKGKVDSKQQSVENYRITRTILPFVPEALLCKRFHVAAPPKHIVTAPADDHRTREEAYFYDEIMKEAAVATEKKKNPIAGTLPEARALLEELSSPASLEQQQQLVQASRPPLTVYKSIFEPDQDDASAESLSPEEEPKDTQFVQDAVSIGKREQQLPVLVQSQTLSSELPTAKRVQESGVKGENVGSGALVPYREDAKPQKDKDRRDRDRRRKRPRSFDSDDDDDSGRRHRKKERKHHKKKKKKKHKSKRRDDD